MKTLSNYISKETMKNLSNYISEKLIVNKDYTDGYNYYPKDIVELKAAILKHYDNGIYDLNDIDTSEVTNFSELFVGDENTGNKDFDVSKWNVGKGENFEQMFTGCKKFNCDLSKWDVSNSMNFLSMFYNCNEFNSDLSKWNVSKCENFVAMFNNCYKFNSDLSDWNISKGKDFYLMFRNCGIDNKNKPKGI